MEFGVAFLVVIIILAVIVLKKTIVIIPSQRQRLLSVSVSITAPFSRE